MLLRLNPPNVPVTYGDGTPVEWRTVLGRLPPASVSPLPVQLAVAGANPVPLWVQAAPLPEAQANKARRVCRQQSRKQGHQPRPQTLLLAGWVLVVTTLPPTLLPDSPALALYRVRWQIEIAIKRWKSGLDVSTCCGPAMRARWRRSGGMASDSMPSYLTTACAARWASSGAGWIEPVPPPGGAPGSCCKPRWPRA